MHKTSGEIHALEYNIPYRAIASRYVRLPDVFSPISSVTKSRLSLGDGLQSESVRPVLGTTGLVRPVLEICWTASFSPVQSWPADGLDGLFVTLPAPFRCPLASVFFPLGTVGQPVLYCRQSIFFRSSIFSIPRSYLWTMALTSGGNQCST